MPLDFHFAYDDPYGSDAFRHDVPNAFDDVDLDPLLNTDCDVEFDPRQIFADVMHGTTFARPLKRHRSPKTVRDRVSPWEFVCSWSDALFARQFRLPRPVFYDIVARLKAAMPNYHLSQIRSLASTPRSGAITMEIKVCITLRTLAGAMYLDMIWYGVQLSSVNPIFIETLSLMDSTLTDAEMFNFNPALPGFKDELARMADQWSAINLAKHGDVVGMETCCGRPIMAGDGLVASCRSPTAQELDWKQDPAIYWNRKGCFALIVSAFCDAWCRFRVFDVKWPGSTPDITAYRQTSLYSWFAQSLIPSEYHCVLDEAYSSIGGDQHLTPFSSNQLALALSTNVVRYAKMLGFNNFLSSQRITIERAFGQFVRKWGIFWRPLEHTIATNTTILMVCAKLHNMSINHWMRTGSRSEDIARADFAFAHHHDAAVFVEDHDDLPTGDKYADLPTGDDGELKKMLGQMENHLREEGTRSGRSSRRDAIANDLWDKGYRYPLSGKNAERVAAAVAAAAGK